MVQQVGNCREEYKCAIFKTLIRDCGCKMCLSTSVWSYQEKPTIRILGKLTRTPISFLYTWHMHIKVSKTFVIKCAKIRHFLQLTASFSLAFSLFTFTGDGFPKTRMPIGDIGSQIACAFANRAGIYCCMLLYLFTPYYLWCGCLRMGTFLCTFLVGTGNRLWLERLSHTD